MDFLVFFKYGFFGIVFQQVRIDFGCALLQLVGASVLYPLFVSIPFGYVNPVACCKLDALACVYDTHTDWYVLYDWHTVLLPALQCKISNYWLGQDGRHYHVPALGLEGWNYGDLKSDVRMQEYALQLNVNLLGLWSKTKNSPWTVEVSPRLGASLTQTDIRTIGDNALHIKGGKRWHLAVGGRLQVSRTIGKHFLAGVYTGMTFLTGRGIDNMPRHIHRSNYVWDSGVRIGYLLGKRTKKAKATALAESIAPALIAEEREEERMEEATIQQPIPVQPADTVVVPDTATVPDAAAVSDTADTAVTAEATDTLATFPVIYFGFDKHTVAPTETAKLQKILSLLQQHSDVQVQIHGYCDHRGTAAYNSPLSLRRAESVKRWLTEHGIPAERISTAGYGIDRTTTDNRHARRAVIIQIRKEESK